VLAISSSTIVFTFGGDPVREGYVASLNRPGGNVTGITWFNNLLRAKALGLLHELVPNAAVIAMMTNAKLPETARTLSDAEEAARTLGRQLLVLNASVPSEIDTAFDSSIFTRTFQQHRPEPEVRLLWPTGNWFAVMHNTACGRV